MKAVPGRDLGLCPLEVPAVAADQPLGPGRVHGPLLALLTGGELERTGDAHDANRIHDEDEHQGKPAKYASSDFCRHGVLPSFVSNP